MAVAESQFQKMLVVENKEHGKCLLLDSTVQFCMNDNLNYTMGMVEPAMAFYTNDTQYTIKHSTKLKRKLTKKRSTSTTMHSSKATQETVQANATTAEATNATKLNILIIGGGDAWVANYLLDKYMHMIEHIQVVDIDRMVSEIVTQHFSHYFKGNNSFNHSMVTYTYENAYTWLQTTTNTNKYDIVIIDCTDNTKQVSEILYTQEFYKNIARVAKNGAPIVQQMNLDDVSVMPFLIKTRVYWEKAGMVDLQTLEVNVASFGFDCYVWVATVKK